VLKFVVVLGFDCWEDVGGIAVVKDLVGGMMIWL
jgi:hypothetical protein